MVKLTKEQAVDLVKKSTVSLEKVMHDKKIAIMPRRVCIFLDRSGSMRSRYEDGIVLTVLRKLLPLGLKFDSNNSIDFGTFDDDARWMPCVNMNNFYDYQSKYVDKLDYGCTYYNTIFEKVYEKYVKKEPSDEPVFLIIITDGDTSNKTECTNWIMKLSYENIFIKFICIPTCGDGFSYLEELDHMKGRFVDNVNSQVINDIENETDESLYTKLLEELPDWDKAFYGKPKENNPHAVDNTTQSDGNALSRFFKKFK